MTWGVSYVSVIFSQSTYKSLRNTEEIPDQNWIIPISYTKQSVPNFLDTFPKIWSFPGKKLILPQLVHANEWILFNIQETGKLLFNSGFFLNLELYQEFTFQLILFIIL